MRGSEALEADEETLEGQILSGKTTKMNGTNGKNGGASSDVKYPANCAMRLSSTPGSDGDENDPYEPKQNKKIVRILTVMVYVFTVSFGKNSNCIFGRNGHHLGLTNFKIKLHYWHVIPQKFQGHQKLKYTLDIQFT